MAILFLLPCHIVILFYLACGDNFGRYLPEVMKYIEYGIEKTDEP